VATIFIDHFSDTSIVFLQEDNASALLVRIKVAFEQNANSGGVRVLQYHAYNARFADNSFIFDVKEQRQSISYCEFKTEESPTR